ncbi:MAG: trypsin-like peptidase domain-containing protein [Verrucomicrobiales bacterium]
MRTKMTDPRPGRPMPHLLNAALIALAAGGVLSLAPAGAAQGDAGAAADAGAARAPAEPPPRLPAGQAAAHFPLLADGGAGAAGLAPDPALPSFAPLMKKVTPAVVSVFPAKLVQEGAADPLARFFGQADEGGSGERAMGVGSGVILSPDGWIVTNSHVVHLPSGMLADAINVELHDRRRFPAKLAGVDPMTDLALLKIEAPDLRPLPVGDSDAVEVGDLVFAVGNPFKVGMTATMGMVSATRRSGLNINGAGGYESFIQTDAAINPGNSGGALVDVRGRLVGVNTAIYGNGGGNIGIGFAIPSQIVRRIAIRLAEEGKVSRGFFGFRTEDVSPEQVKAAGLDAIAGAVVAEIMAGSPADKAGMEPGDIITRLGDAAVENLGDLRLRLSFIKPGETAVMELAAARAGSAPACPPWRSVRDRGRRLVRPRGAAGGWLRRQRRRTGGRGSRAEGGEDGVRGRHGDLGDQLPAGHDRGGGGYRAPRGREQSRHPIQGCRARPRRPHRIAEPDGI